MTFNLSYISLVLVGWFLGLFTRYLYRKVRAWYIGRRPDVLMLPGESGIERYQEYKKNLQAIEPPPGTDPEAAERFKLLSPTVQRQVVGARKLLGLDG